jgi:hypothetical protein
MKSDVSPQEKRWTIFLMVVSCIYLGTILTMPVNHIPGVPSTRTIPILLGTLLLVMAGGMLFRTGLTGLFQRNSLRKAGTPWSEIFVLIIVVYIIVLPLIGFLLATVLFMPMAMFYLRPQSASLPKILFWGVLITVLLWLTFGLLLRVPLPVGKFWS